MLLTVLLALAFLLLSAVISVAASYQIAYGNYHNTYKFISYDPKKKIMTLKRTSVPTFFKRYIGRATTKTNEVRFEGSNTVWRTFPDFRRCGWGIEDVLYEFWKRWEYEQKHGSIDG